MSTSEALRDRLAAAEALGGFQLDERQRRNIVPLVAGASPLELAWLLRAFAGDADETTGSSLVAALKESQATASISVDRLAEALAGYPADVQSAAAPLLERNAPDEAERAAKLEAVLTGSGGDTVRGEQVFFSQRAACAACHRVGTRGEKIGPDLSTIGQVRRRRDLAEAVLFPSASLARGYESYTVVTGEGQVHTGLIGRETTAALYLRTTDRTEIRIARDEVDQLAPTAASIMPQGLDKTLSPEELRDVVAYLESLK